MRSALAAMVVFVRSAAAALSQEKVSPVEQALRTHAGFVFVRGGCELGEAYCATRIAKDWTVDAVPAIQAALHRDSFVCAIDIND